MFKKALAVLGAMLAVLMLMAAVLGYGVRRAAAEGEINAEPLDIAPVVADGGFSVEVLINGVPATEYAARGRRYIEAFENAEYELRIRNQPAQMAVHPVRFVRVLLPPDGRGPRRLLAHAGVSENERTRPRE